MKTGYVISAINGKYDYIKMAYAAAMSIKHTQRVNNVSLLVSNKNDVDDRYKWVFDDIVEVLNDNKIYNSNDTTYIDRLNYHYMPYERSIFIDSDMLFFTDISEWWDMIDNDICFTNYPLTYRGERLCGNYYRKVFTENDLPDLYTGMMVVKKSSLSDELYEMIDIIMSNWKYFYKEYLLESCPNFCSSDVSYSLAVNLLGISDRVVCGSIPTFVHMKSHIQGWKYPEDDWREMVPMSIDQKWRCTIGVYRQTLPVHYTIKEILGDTIVDQLEKLNGK